jgi:nucleotide-binding universal stress UspA family protein
MEGGVMGRVVVGVDGSASSVEALRQAADAARSRGATLEVVSAWYFPGLAMLPGPEDVPTPQKLEGAARQTVDDTIEQAGPEALAGLEVERRVIEGHPAEALTKAAEGAELLVVGSHGRGGFRGMLLGSVSAHCVHHASSPVLVARTDR